VGVGLALLASFWLLLGLSGGVGTVARLSRNVRCRRGFSLRAGAGCPAAKIAAWFLTLKGRHVHSIARLDGRGRDSWGDSSTGVDLLFSTSIAFGMVGFDSDYLGSWLQMAVALSYRGFWPKNPPLRPRRRLSRSLYSGDPAAGSRRSVNHRPEHRRRLALTQCSLHRSICDILPIPVS